MSLVAEALVIFPGLKKFSKESLSRLDQYYDLLVKENEVQNLTRLVSTKDFIEGHLQDCLEAAPLLGKYSKIMDLGSGAGVPGLVCAVLLPDIIFILAESENNKARFLRDVIETLELENVEVFYGRGEDYLRDNSVDAVICRAVGTVGKIYEWIGRCSTWNTLILFKGPKWNDEWPDFKKEKRRAFAQKQEYSYAGVGSDEKSKVIVTLNR